MFIKIKYFDESMPKLEFIEGKKSDWIDLRAAEELFIPANTFAMIHLGVAMKLPEGYEAHIAPRSSTFKKWGIIEVNSVGIIDESYAGDGDEWMMPVYAIRDTNIHKGDRVCQFRIMEKQPTVQFVEVKHLEDENRGGFGSTGSN